MNNSRLIAAINAATETLPPTRFKDRIILCSVCPYCNQPMGEGGRLERGDGGPDGLAMEECDERGMVDPPPRSPRPAKTPERIARFLEGLRDYPLPIRAARAGGCSLRAFQDWRTQDPEFRDQWLEAHAEGVERLEERAHHDAMHGHDREATLQRMFVIKRHKPEYRDNTVINVGGDAKDARDASLLRRAMVESLGPYPEARAALAAALLRLQSGMTPAIDTSSTAPETITTTATTVETPTTDKPRPKARRTRSAPAGKVHHQVGEDEIIDAELVTTVQPGEELGRSTPPPGARARDDARAGGGGRPPAGMGPIPSPSTSSIPPKKDLTRK